MSGKRVEQRKLTMCILSKINEKKHVLFDPFSTTVTKQIRCDAWKSIGQYAQSLGVLKENKDWTHIRDVWWKNILKMSMEKLDNRKKTGSEGGPNCKENEIDFLVYEILGKESPVLEGLNVAESLSLETETIKIRTDNEPSDLEVPTQITPLNLNEKPSERDPTEPTRKNNAKRNSIIEEREDLILKKTKMTIEILEKEIKLKDLQIQNTERDNYLKELQMRDYELKYGLPRSRFTCHIEQFSMAVFIPDSEHNVNTDELLEVNSNT